MDPHNRRYADTPLSADPDIREDQLDCRHALPTPLSETVLNVLRKIGKALKDLIK